MKLIINYNIIIPWAPINLIIMFKLIEQITCCFFELKFPGTNSRTLGFHFSVLNKFYAVFCAYYLYFRYLFYCNRDNKFLKSRLLHAISLLKTIMRAISKNSP